MKATELRIGNYLNWDGVKTVFGLEHFQDIKLYPNESRKYSPIPLNIHWLLSFGFKESYSFDCYYYNIKGIESICLEDSLVFIYDYNGLEIKYVHQLQNLYFALTNEELILK